MLANALYWVEEYHVDGLRVDAVASMLYLDYGKEPGQWVPNKNGGNENLEAVEFFKHLNTLVRGRNKGVIMIAEESTTWPKVTGSVEDGGLHFSYKWNMGWMHDFLDYMKLDPYFRKYNHNKMTFGMTYAFSENYILVLSHDEVVHLKCSMINKMPGDLEEKFQNLMVGYAFMFGHPGKKLLFMGQDFGQLREWSEEREIDWFLLADEGHQHLQTFFSDLLKMYRKYPALYANDCGYEASSGSMPTTATAAFTASSAGHRREKQPVVRLQFHTGRASGLYVWRTAQKTVPPDTRQLRYEIRWPDRKTPGSLPCQRGRMRWPAISDCICTSGVWCGGVQLLK